MVLSIQLVPFVCRKFLHMLCLAVRTDDQLTHALLPVKIAKKSHVFILLVTDQECQLPRRSTSTMRAGCEPRKL